MISPSPALITRCSKGWLGTLDPGVDHPAVSLWYNGTLQVAERVPLPGKLKKLDSGGNTLGTGERCRQITDLIVEWFRQRTPAVDTFVYENPQVYRAGAGKSKGDPNGLMKLALVAAGVAARLGVYTVSPHPGDWCQIPKDEDNPDPWASPRGRLIANRLGPVQKLACASNHDSVDSVGLALWSMGRLDRVFPGSIP